MAAENLRNVALIGHGGSGKTSLAEALLFTSGVINRLGRVEDGSTTTDYEPEETKRGISLTLGMAHYEHEKAKVNILDTPGYADFIGEVISALRVTDGAILVLSAVGGVEVQAEIVWEWANHFNVPLLIVVNKMDRENVDFKAVLDSARSKLGSRCISVQLPIGQAEDFGGVADLVALKAYREQGGKVEEGPLPDDLEAEASSLREQIVDAVAESDDALLEKYLEGGEISQQELERGLRKAVAAAKVVPVLCASATKLIGIDALKRTINAYLPSPDDMPVAKGVNPTTKADDERKASATEPFSSFVFKTMADPFVGKLSLFRVYSGAAKSDSQVYNANQQAVEKFGQLFVLRGKKQEGVGELEAGDIGAIAKLSVSKTSDTLCVKEKPITYPAIEFPEALLSASIEPKAKGDEEKLSSSLQRLSEEDPTFHWRRDAELKQTIISGIGEMHIEVIVDRLKRKFGVEAVLGAPKVAYRETVRGNARVQGRYKKQTGGRGQYGDCWIEMAPLPRGGGFEFVDKIFGGSIPQQFRPAVEKGIRESMEEGVIAGYPVVDMKVTLVDGSFHSVDSSEMAFKIAGSMAFKSGMQQAQPTLLEPVMNVEVDVPDNLVGDVIGDLNSRRGRVAGMEPMGGRQMVKAQVPGSEMVRYAVDLRSISGGRARYRMDFSHYEEV
ncbi:MAG TPA: elongation factor G, partial [Candidatus Methylomirabilis sp.]|nr:elongation factor G [Candidatus Methylomirabilis sp.]